MPGNPTQQGGALFLTLIFDSVNEMLFGLRREANGYFLVSIMYRTTPIDHISTARACASDASIADMVEKALLLD